MLVCLKKCLCLRPAHLVQGRVHAITLHNAPAVKIGFAVANNV